MAHTYDGSGGGAPDVSDRRLFVGNLKWEVTPDQLEATFSPFGPVRKAQVPVNDQGRSRGIGFVWFEHPEDAQRALAEMDGKDLMGRPLKVSFAIERSRGPGGFRGGGPPRSTDYGPSNGGYPAPYAPEADYQMQQSYASYGGAPPANEPYDNRGPASYDAYAAPAETSRYGSGPPAADRYDPAGYASHGGRVPYDARDQPARDTRRGYNEPAQAPVPAYDRYQTVTSVAEAEPLPEHRGTGRYRSASPAGRGGPSRQPIDAAYAGSYARNDPYQPGAPPSPGSDARRRSPVRSRYSGDRGDDTRGPRPRRNDRSPGRYARSPPADRYVSRREPPREPAYGMRAPRDPVPDRYGGRSRDEPVHAAPRYSDRLAPYADRGAPAGPMPGRSAYDAYEAPPRERYGTSYGDDRAPRDTYGAPPPRDRDRRYSGPPPRR